MRRRVREPATSAWLEQPAVAGRVFGLDDAAAHRFRLSLSVTGKGRHPNPHPVQTLPGGVRELMFDQSDSSKPARKSVQCISRTSGPHIATGDVLLNRRCRAVSISIED